VNVIIRDVLGIRPVFEKSIPSIFKKIYHLIVLTLRILLI